MEPTSPENEDRNRRFSRHFQAILDVLPDNLSVLSPDLKILWTNESVIRLSGRKSDDITGIRCHDLWHERSEPCGECPVVRAFRTGRMETGTTKTPDERVWDMRAIPIRDEAGSITEVIQVARDITEQRDLETQLRHVQKMEAMGTLAGGIAHDFNNILSVISGYSALMEMTMDRACLEWPYLAEIKTAAARAAQLTKGLLVLSRRQAADLVPMDINDVVRSTHRVLARVLGEDIELSMDLANDTLAVRGDFGRIEQILLNLVANARDAMPRGGALSIRTGRGELSPAFIERHGYGRPGPYAVVEVEDNGDGMDDETRRHIFEPFFTTKEAGQGTGLGLSIVYGIVKQHGGYVTCEGAPGRGSTFRIYFPIVQARAGGRKRYDEEEISLPRGNETILLAEDDEGSRRLVRTLLERHGYRVIEAADGEEAVRLFGENGVDLLLFDLVMPRKNGWDAWKEIEHRAPRLKVVFLSGYAAEALDRKGIHGDGLNLIRKPVMLRNLLEKVRSVLDEKTA